MHTHTIRMIPVLVALPFLPEQVQDILEQRIAQRYSEAYARAWWVGKRHLKTDQQKFLTSRDACGVDTKCLLAVMQRRVQTIGISRWS